MRMAAGLGLTLLLGWGAQTTAPARPDAERGRALFEGAGGCLACHAVDERGGTAARDLSWIGVLRTPESLRSRVLNAAHHPGAANLTEPQVDDLVSYLRTLRRMWTVEAGERTREIAPPTENAAFFDRPDRDAQERPERLIDALDIPKGARVADLGSGTGYFTWRLAQAVGPAGRVMAIDVQQEMLDLTANAVRQHGLENVEYVLADDDDPRLPPGALDFVFIAYAYHEFGDPEAIMRAVRQSLKPGGRVLILEYAKESNIAPAAPLHKMSFEEIRREIEPLGFVVDRLLDFLPVQHGVIFATVDRLRSP